MAAAGHQTDERGRVQRKVFGGMRMGSEVSNNGAATSTSGPEAVVKWNSARAVPFVCPEATALAVSRRQTGASVPQSVCASMLLSKTAMFISRDGNGSGSGRVEKKPTRERTRGISPNPPVTTPAGEIPHPHPHPSGFGWVSGPRRVCVL